MGCGPPPRASPVHARGVGETVCEVGRVWFAEVFSASISSEKAVATCADVPFNPAWDPESLTPMPNRTSQLQGMLSPVPSTQYSLVCVAATPASATLGRTHANTMDAIRPDLCNVPRHVHP